VCNDSTSIESERTTETDTKNSVPTSETEWTELKALLDKRYTEIATLLRYNKTREETIQRLSAEVQKYREGFAFSALKPFINTLISFREECRKSQRDAIQYAIDDEKAKKYIAFLVDDFAQMLINIGLERSENTITINKRPLIDNVGTAFMLSDCHYEPTTDDTALILTNAEPVNNISQLYKYLNTTESTILSIIKDKATTDQTIAELSTIAKRTDAEHYLALVAPISRQLFVLQDCLTKMSQPTEETPLKQYDRILTYIIDKIETTLTEVGVQIETATLDSAFDPQKQKIQKTIVTTDEALDRTIANCITNCYIYEGKVIYQSRVDVYKYQNQIGE